MANKEIELLKYKRNSVSRTYEIATETELLGIGGMEGRKFINELNVPKVGKSNFFIKELDWAERDYQVRPIVESYATMKRKGFPVPNTVRYFWDKQSKTYKILMTDVTRGGEYWIWSSSDYMKKEQYLELHAMELGFNDIYKLKMIIKSLVKKANKEDVMIRWCHYHVLKHKQTGKIEVNLLDLDESTKLFQRIQTYNTENADRFLDDLNYARKIFKREKIGGDLLKIA